MRRVVVAVALAAGACAPAAAAEPSVTLTEFRVEVDGSVAPAPTVVPVHNSGSFPHTIVVTAADGSVVTATPVIQPGETLELALDLEPGRYELSCRIVVQRSDHSLVDHYEEGMRAEITVAG